VNEKDWKKEKEVGGEVEMGVKGEGDWGNDAVGKRNRGGAGTLQRRLGEWMWVEVILGMRKRAENGGKRRIGKRRTGRSWKNGRVGKTEGGWRELGKEGGGARGGRKGEGE
jgi:hypothetical protein